MTTMHIDHLTDLSLEILNKITDGLDFSIPDIDESAFKLPDDLLNILSKSPTEIDEKLLTERKVNGAGVFDGIMVAIKAHLLEEYQSGRITGAEYTKAYAALVGTALQSAVQFCLNKDSTYWQAINAQVQALTAQLQFEKARLELLLQKYSILTQKADYANKVAGLAAIEANYDDMKYKVEHTYPKQIEHITAQISHINEQREAERAQTLDNRSDGALVTGKIGMEKKVYKEQINSYVKDAVQKAAKLYTDTWVTQKTVDIGTQVPSNLDKNAINTVINKLKSVSVDSANVI